MHAVIKRFTWSENGYETETLKVGAERDFGAAAAGLKSEGYIGDVTGAGEKAEKEAKAKAEAEAKAKAEKEAAEKAKKNGK